MTANAAISSRTEPPFLTIGITSYNYARYLSHAFKQIKKQTFRDFEILYCDDGSTDGSREIIQEFIRDNPDMQIRLIAGANEGILANRNRILKHARGTYLMICDADDYVLDDCLESLCQTARATGADCVIGGFAEVDEHGHCLKRHVPGHNSSKWLYTWHHAQIYKLDIIRRNSIHFTGLPDDVFFLQQVHLFCKTTAFVEKVLYDWCRHADSTSIDIEGNPDWNPIIIWKKLSAYIAQLQTHLPENSERNNLTYYLYKWFYFNVSDLPVSSRQKLTENVCSMQKQMASVCPDHHKPSSIISALGTKDTLFARTAVALCWITEQTGLLPLLPVVRTFQHKIRTLRRSHEKA